MDPSQIQLQRPPDETPNSINRAIWLRQWKLVPYRLYSLIWTLFPNVFLRILNVLGIRVGNDFVWALLLCVAAGFWIVGFIYLLNKSNRLNDYKSFQIISKKTQSLLAVIGIAGGLALGGVTGDRGLNYVLLYFVILQLVLTCFELRGIQKKLMEKTDLQVEPFDQTWALDTIATHLSEAEVLNQKNETKKLFVRAKLV